MNKVEHVETQIVGIGKSLWGPTWASFTMSKGGSCGLPVEWGPMSRGLCMECITGDCHMIPPVDRMTDWKHDLATTSMVNSDNCLL